MTDHRVHHVTCTLRSLSVTMMRQIIDCRKLIKYTANLVYDAILLLTLSNDLTSMSTIMNIISAQF